MIAQPLLPFLKVLIVLILGLVSGWLSTPTVIWLAHFWLLCCARTLFWVSWVIVCSLLGISCNLCFLAIDSISNSSISCLIRKSFMLRTLFLIRPVTFCSCVTFIAFALCKLVLLNEELMKFWGNIRILGVWAETYSATYWRASYGSSNTEISLLVWVEGLYFFIWKSLWCFYATFTVAASQVGSLAPYACSVGLLGGVLNSKNSSSSLILVWSDTCYCDASSITRSGVCEG